MKLKKVSTFEGNDKCMTVWLFVFFLGEPEADVVVIGSGIGGLCCGALLARYNQDVLVLESHDLPGGAAHSFEIKGYKFDSGPSLFSGLQSRGPQANPLAQVKCLSSFNSFFLLESLVFGVCFYAFFWGYCGFQVLDALGESLPCAKYDSWMVYLPEGDFLSRIGPTDFFKVTFFSFLAILQSSDYKWW